MIVGDLALRSCPKRLYQAPDLPTTERDSTANFLFKMSVFKGVRTPILFISLLGFFINFVTAAPTSLNTSDLKITFESPHVSRIVRRQDGSSTLAASISKDFPDPCLLQSDKGRWLSFATSGNGNHIQVAVADDPHGEWKHLDQDALPGDGWTSGKNFWAPDVRMLGDKSYIMYFSGELPGGGHCIGAARSETDVGPYEMDPEPLVCPSDEGGAIDPAGFLDKKTGKRYIMYKVDGNALGGGAATPIRLQQVDAADGSTLIGDAITIMDRIVSEDGPLVEAPSLVSTPGGAYMLFFSSHMYTDSKYDVKYAVAESIEGPYVRGPGPLLQTPWLGLTGPGGGTSPEDGGVMAFHGWCGDGKGRRGKRCMYLLGYSIG